MDYNTRDKILFNEEYNEKDYVGGIKRFNYLNTEDAKELIELGFLDPQEKQNDSPTVKEFIEFCEKYPCINMFGYAVSKNRDDVRVSIEGLIGNDTSEFTNDSEFEQDLYEIACNADEFEDDRNTLWVWFD